MKLVPRSSLSRYLTLSLPCTVDNDLLYFSSKFGLKKSFLIQSVVDVFLNNLDYAHGINLIEIRIPLNAFVLDMQSVLDFSSSHFPSDYVSVYASCTLSNHSFGSISVYSSLILIKPVKLIRLVLVCSMNHFHVVSASRVVKFDSYLESFSDVIWRKFGFLKSKDSYQSY